MYINILNFIEYAYIFFLVNDSGRLYLDTISDNVSKSTRVIDVLKMITRSFLLGNYFNSTNSKTEIW